VGHAIQDSATPLALMVAGAMIFSLGMWWHSLRPHRA
jgi:hypothetical protein